MKLAKSTTLITLSLGLLSLLIVSCSTHATVDKSIFSSAKLSYDNGNYEKAILELEQTIKRARKDGVGEGQLCPYLQMLAQSYFYTNDYDKALPLSKEALSLARNLWGNDPKTTPYIKLQIRILYKQKKFQESFQLANQLLEQQEKMLGSDSKELIETLNLIIAAACAEDRCADTKPLLERQLALRKKHLGDSHEHVAASLTQLAEIEENKGNLDKAESIYKEVLAIRRKSAPHLVESTEKNLVRIELKRLNPKGAVTARP